MSARHRHPRSPPLAMTLIVGVRYLLRRGGFALATRLRHPGLYAGLDRADAPRDRLEPRLGGDLWRARRGRRLGLAAIAAGRGSTATSHAFPLWYLPLSVLLYLLAHDSWFYWTHRWMHRPRPFRIAHAVHHASRPPTAWAAMAFHPIEALTGAVVIPLLVFLIPIHAGALGVVLTIMTVMGVTNHMGWEIFPAFMWRGRLGAWLITASHHQRHHERYGGNYGLYFRFWDRLCGTDRGDRRFRRRAPARGSPGAWRSPRWRWRCWPGRHRPVT